ncbi:MAG: hypothetical protein IJL35_06025 [Bacteroidaceae bacterium]|nr:hypothetical protein [Bacteroidaceae bacterium]
MSQLPIMKFVFDRRKRASAQKYGSVELDVTYNRRHKYMTTGVRILPKEWRNGHVVGRMDAMELNS